MSRGLIAVGFAFVLGACDSPGFSDPGVAIAAIHFDSLAARIYPVGAEVLVSSISGATTADGDTVGVPQNGVAWSSSNEAVLEVSQGTASMRAAGFAYLRATHRGKTDSIELEILPRFTVTPVLSLGTSSVTITGVNVEGTIVGTVFRMGSAVGFIWKNSTATEPADCRPAGVNDVGQIVCGTAAGVAMIEGSNRTDLAGLEGLIPLGTSASGEIAAWANCFQARCDTLFLRRVSGAIVKQRVSRPSAPIPLLLKRGPNTHGDVLFVTAEAYRKPGVWDSANEVNVVLGGYARYGDVNAINDARNAVGSGESVIGSGPVRPLFWLAVSGTWTPKTMGSVLVGAPDYVKGPSGDAFDINNSDDVVGRMSVTGGNGGFIWSPHLRGGLVPLNSVLPGDAWDVTSADRISNNRRIAAQATNKQSGERWVVLLSPP